MRRLFLGIMLVVETVNLSAQDTEFPKGWVLNLEAFQGLTTSFNGMPDLYVGELRFNPQYTIVPHSLRVGLVPALHYNNRIISGTFGPQLSLKIKTFSIKQLFSSFANLQLTAEHLWGTNHQKLIGGGFKLELGQLILLSIVAHRDYNLLYWSFQTGVGINFIQPHVPSLHPR